MSRLASLRSINVHGSEYACSPRYSRRVYAPSPARSSTFNGPLEQLPSTSATETRVDRGRWQIARTDAFEMQGSLLHGALSSMFRNFGPRVGVSIDKPSTKFFNNSKRTSIWVISKRKTVRVFYVHVWYTHRRSTIVTRHPMNSCSNRFRRANDWSRQK